MVEKLKTTIDIAPHEVGEHGIDFLNDQKAWKEKIDGLIKKNKPKFFDLRGEWQRIMDKSTQPEVVAEWPSDEQHTYLNALGRLAAGLEGCYWQSMPIFRENLLYEVRALAHLLPSHREQGIAMFLEVASMFIAKALDTNTSGNASEYFYQYIKTMVTLYEKSGMPEARDMLMNPFGLKLGTELFSYDKKSVEIIAKHVTDIEIDGVDVLIMLEGDKHIYEIEEINRDLGSGELMLRSGDNSFGGLAYLEEKLAMFGSGKILRLEWEDPITDETKVLEVKCLGTNAQEVEEQYGKAYIPFMRRFPQASPLVTVRFEGPDGKASEHFDIREYLTKYTVSVIS